MRDGGAAHDELATQHGLIFVVRRAEMDYLRPARLDDLLVVHTETVALGGASIKVRQSFTVGQQPVGVLQVKLACIRQMDGRPARIPDRWRIAFGADLGE
jgi:acyl-CoA thioester hydrolase